MKKALLIAIVLPFAAKAQQKPLTDAQFLNQSCFTYLTTNTNRTYEVKADTVPVIICCQNEPKRAYRVRFTLKDFYSRNKPVTKISYLCEDRKTPLATPGQISK